MPVLQVISEALHPIKVWAADVEESARQQLVRTGNLPFIFKWVAVMPDVHAGKGSTIGTVIATQGAIVPACVGVDLGCGMRAVRTTLAPERILQHLPVLRQRIEAVIPTGFDINATDANLERLGRVDQQRLVDGVRTMQSRARLEGHSDRLLQGLDRFPRQLGSLGGGNHFVEVCVSGRGEVWVMLHSGSRGAGNLVAQHHMRVARGEMKRLLVDLLDPDLAYLSQGTPQYEAYIHDMLWAQEFARLNREVMMAHVLESLATLAPFSHDPPIDCHHNYVAHEHHYGADVLVTRKGAVRAGAGDLGVIPGSMGTRSYIVRGLGNPESFCSCSHGAGRRMSRTQARRQFTSADLVEQTQGVECRKDAALVDEIPGAYKSIDQVMADQRDLVEVVEELKQVLCVKGA